MLGCGQMLLYGVLWPCVTVCTVSRWCTVASCFKSCSIYCRQVSTTKETFQDLSLPIPTKDHLQVLHSGHPLTVPVGGAMVGPRGGTCGDQLGSQSWLSRMFSWMKRYSEVDH